MSTPDRLLEHLSQIENLAEEVLVQQSDIVALDKRRQKTREASRGVINQLKSNPKEKTWLALGGLFVKVQPKKTVELLQHDLTELDSEINRQRDELKLKVEKLRDAENKPQLVGYNLKPLSSEEKQAVHLVLSGKRV